MRSGTVANRVRLAQDFSKGGRTKQSFKDECDIKNIMKRFEKTGMVSHLVKFPSQYMDLTGAVEYQEALNIILSAQQAFEALPSKVRQRFENNPAQFLAFCETPGNEKEMQEMGLIPTPVDAKPSEPVVDPAKPEVKK